jgi:hypothetical protein
MTATNNTKTEIRTLVLISSSFAVFDTQFYFIRETEGYWENPQKKPGARPGISV